MVVVRPLSDEVATALKGEQIKLDWFLTSQILAPACGLEEVTDLKPDHAAVRLPLKLDSGCLSVSRLVCGDRRSTRNRMSLTKERLRLGSRGRLLLAQRQRVAPVPVKEAMTAAKQKAMVAQLKRQVLASGPCASLEWPDFLGPHYLESEQQLNCLDAWYQQIAKADAKQRREGWNQYVKDMWKIGPKKIYKWIRGTAVVWDLAVHDDDDDDDVDDGAFWSARESHG
eukprot:6463351-Amphidinium_carterae.1